MTAGVEVSLRQNKTKCAPLQNVQPEGKNRRSSLSQGREMTQHDGLALPSFSLISELYDRVV